MTKRQQWKACWLDWKKNKKLWQHQKDLKTKVKGKSALAALCGQTPIPFNGLKEMIFSMDNEIDIVAENGKKTEGGIDIATVKIVQIKFE